MHSVIKSSFYMIFLVLALFVSVKLLLNSKGNKKIMIFGLLTFLLGIGEGFHIVPRILEIFNSDIDTYGPLMDSGRFISSISIIIVYLLLFWFWRVYYGVTDKKHMEIILLVLGFIGVILSVVLKDSSNFFPIILRNLPTLAIGSIVIYQYKNQATTSPSKGFGFMWLSLLLSLVFTIGFELLSYNYVFFTILMMPKTLMFIWIVLMGYMAYRRGLLVKK